jgi:hypothetical protein
VAAWRFAFLGEAWPFFAALTEQFGISNSTGIWHRPGRHASEYGTQGQWSSDGGGFSL